MKTPHLQTFVLGALFISVLMLTGCSNDTTPATTTSTQTSTTQQPTTTTDSTSSTNTTQTTTQTDTPTTTTTPSNTTTQVASKTLTSDFQKYSTPAGDEEVKVTATIDNKGIVQKVELAYVTNAIKSKEYQNLFSEGISAQVVGKSIKDINVGVVNGSSLTGKGFNKAISQISDEYYAN